MAYKYAAFDGFKRLAAAGGNLQSFGSEQTQDPVESHQT
jgi:hypothetical protein